MSDVEQVEPEIEVSVVDGCGGGSNSGCPGDGTSDDNISNSTNRCVSFTLRVIFSTPGLVFLVVGYSIMGALIFPILEAPAEVQGTMSISKSREDCLKELWTITERLNVLYERNWTLLVHEQLRRFEGSIVAATKGGFVETMGDRFPRWSFSEALLYSVTVITTIGHGNLTPRTSEGKIVTMLYALVGVPLMLMCLSSLGGLLADALQCAYSKLCIVRSSKQTSHDMAHEGCQQSEEMDCNMCRYDSIHKNTNKYHPVNDKEDSCQLIRNSPKKSLSISPHTSPLKNFNTNQSIVGVMGHQQQQPQQQQQQLMGKSSSPKHHNLVVNQMHHQHQHQQQYHHHQIGNMPAVTSGATVYFPTTGIQCHSHHTHQINAKYQDMQMQTHLGNNERNNHNIMHTATVHSIGRSKFIPKPLPQEINMLLAECDISCHQDTSVTNTNKCGKMETVDEDDDDDNRSGCPHDTPSRIPLISTKSSSQKRRLSTDSCNLSDDNLDDHQQYHHHHHLHNHHHYNNQHHHNQLHHNCNNKNSPQVPITIILLILISYISLGTVIFSLWENWSIIDGAYFCFVTLSTIGFGDLVPKRTFRGPELQLFACCAYLMLGLVLVAMSFSLVENQLLWKCRRVAVKLKLAKD